MLKTKTRLKLHDSNKFSKALFFLVAAAAAVFLSALLYELEPYDKPETFQTLP